MISSSPQCVRGVTWVWGGAVPLQYLSYLRIGFLLSWRGVNKKTEIISKRLFGWCKDRQNKTEKSMFPVFLTWLIRSQYPPSILPPPPLPAKLHLCHMWHISPPNRSLFIDSPQYHWTKRLLVMQFFLHVIPACLSGPNILLRTLCSDTITLFILTHWGRGF